MNISATSSYSYFASAGRLHSVSCNCAACSAARVQTSIAPADIQYQEGKTELAKVGKQLTPEEQQQVDKLVIRDREVRQHEQAHMSAAGGLVQGSPSFTYQRGPDGINYAIGGEVSIDVSTGRTPEETLRKAEQIERAALAPKDPSGPDRAVAAQARQMALEAQAQLAEQKGGDTADTTTTPANGTGNRAQQAYQTQQNAAGQAGVSALGLISAYA